MALPITDVQPDDRPYGGMTDAAPSTAGWGGAAATWTALAVFMTLVLLFFFMAGLLECTSSASDHRERKCIPFKRPAFSSQLLANGHATSITERRWAVENAVGEPGSD